MKILMYIPQPGPTRAPELVANLAKLGNKVIAISPPERQMFDVGASIRPIRYSNVPFIGPLLLIIFGLLIAVFEIIRSKPDVIYTLGGSMSTGLLMARLFRCPLVSEVNGWRRSELELIRKSLLSMLISKVSCRMDEIEIKHSDQVVVVSPGIKEAVRNELNVCAEKIIVVPNGANTELFRPISAAKDILQLESDYLYVGFVGVIAPWQGLDNLIKSAPLILKEMPNTKFLIVGGGESSTQLIELIRELQLEKHFISYGVVPYTEISKYVSAMDVCISFRKGTPASPLKLYEYMVCGKAIVATKDLDNEFVTEHNAGILVDPEKHEEVAEAIVDLLRSGELREQMGKNGMTYVLENRKWENVAEEVEKTIRTLTAERT